MQVKPFELGLAVYALTASAAFAQQQESLANRPDLDTTNIISRSIGIQATADELRGMAHNYEVVFGSDRIDFYPSLGVLTDEDYSLRIRLESVGRSNGAMQTAAVRGRSSDQRQVRYDRGTFDEVYELRHDGMEQSFLFRELPAGSGDLIVRYRVDTALRPSLRGSTDSGMQFGLDGAGAATIGSVTGIDAEGARCGGSMRFDAGMLEFVLPGAFVETARLPLLVDPLIGSTVTIPTVTSDRRPDVAYDVTNDVYLIVFQREIGSTTQIRGLLADSNGAPIGNTIAINTTTTVKVDPCVANLSSSDAFVVCWNEAANIMATGVRASDGFVLDTAGVAVAATSDFEVAPDVGGDATLVDDDAIIVWWNLTTNEIYARQFTITSSGLVFPILSMVRISGNAPSTNMWPCISKSGGPTGRHLICWQRAIGDFEIRGAVVDRNIGFRDDFIAITSSPVDDIDPACDGNGTDWIVAWERAESATSSNHDIYCTRVSFESAAGTVHSTRAIEDDPNDDERNPSVGWVGDSALVAFADQLTPRYGAFVATVDPFTCESCERATLEAMGRDADYIAIATQFSGGGNNSDALCIWESTSTITSNSQVLGRAFRADDGDATDLGGGCGLGGTSRATCARQGHAAFTHRLRGAAPNSPALLLLSFDRLFAVCAPCVLVPDPFTGWGFPVTTDALGNASVPMPIPSVGSSTGLVFYDQWLVATPTPTCGALSNDLSNAIRVRIQ